MGMGISNKRKWLGLDPDRLYVTYYPKDPETKSLWMDKVGLPEDHIIPVEDNFWISVQAHVVRILRFSTIVENIIT